MRRYSIKVDWRKLACRSVLIAAVGGVFFMGAALDDWFIGMGAGLCWGILIGRRLEGKPLHITREKPEAPHE